MSWWMRLRYNQEKEVLKVLAHHYSDNTRLLGMTPMEIVAAADGRIDAYHCPSTLIELRDYKTPPRVASINMGDHYRWIITEAGKRWLEDRR